MKRFTIITICLLVVPAACAQLESDDYAIHPLDINAGGGASSSAAYSVTTSTGQAGGVGLTSSVDYDLHNGFLPATLWLDCNENGVPDDQDIADGASEDCNDNGVPDECDGDADSAFIVWVGDTGLWSVAENWCPPVVPNNTAEQVFHVSISGPDSIVTLDIVPLPVTLQSLNITDGAQLLTTSDGGNQALVVVDVFTNSSTVEVRDSRTLTIEADIAQGPAGRIQGAGADSTIELTADTLIVGGTLAAADGALVLLDGCVGEAITLEASGGGNIEAINDGTLIDPTVHLLEIPDGNLCLVDGVIDNIGQILVNATSLPTAMEPTLDSERMILHGSGELTLHEDPDIPVSRAYLGHFQVPFENNAGHTISGTGRIDASTIINDGTIIAIAAGNRSLTLFAGLIDNTRDIVVEPDASLVAYGDFTISSVDGLMEVGTGGSVDVFGTVTASQGGTYTTSGLGGTLLYADGLVILDNMPGQDGSLVELNGQARAEVYGEIIVNGTAPCRPGRGCTPPILRMRDEAYM